MSITPTQDQKSTYREVIEPARVAADKNDGTEESVANVLKKLIEVDDWIANKFPEREYFDVDGKLVQEDGRNPQSQTITELLALAYLRGVQAIEQLSKALTGSEIPDSASLIPIIQVKGIIIPSDPGSGPLLPSSGAAIQREPAFIDRLALIITALHEIRIYTDDLILYRGELADNQMRKHSYILIEIPRIGGEIVICDQVGEATFVSNRSLGIEAYQRLTKSQLEATPGVLRVVHNDTDVWTREILQHLQSNQVGGKKIDINDLIALRKAIQDSYPSAKKFLELPGKTRAAIKIAGLGLKAIATIFDVKGTPVGNYDDYVKLCAKIWGEGHPDIAEALNKSREDRQLRETLGSDPNKWRDHIETLKDSNGQSYTAVSFLALPKGTVDKEHTRLGLKIAGLGLKAIARIFDVKGNPVDDHIAFAKLCAKLFPVR